MVISDKWLWTWNTRRLNAIVGYEEKFNNAIVRHALDSKNEPIFHNPNPLNVTFRDVKKFYVVNPVIGKLATQVKASKLTDYELTKNILGQGETDKLQNRFDLFRGLGVDDSDDDENTGGISRGGGGGGGDDGTPPRPRTNLYGGNSPQENSRRVAQANEERFQNRILRDRERDVSNIPRGIVRSRRTILNINLPETTPPTPFDYIPHPPSTPRETSFLFSESLSPLQNTLPNIAPLPSRTSIDTFARSLTRIVDDQTNTIEITPKKSTPSINEKSLSKQLQEVLPNFNEITKEDSNNEIKEIIDDLNEALNKIGKFDDRNDQKLFEFEFSTGGKNPKFEKHVTNFGPSSDNLEFLNFIQSDFCKEILETNDLQFILKMAIIIIKILTLMNQFLNSLKINKILWMVR